MVASFVSGALTLIGLIVGIAIGPLIASLLDSRLQGFDTGVWIATPVWIAVSVLSAYLGGSLGEEVLGTRFGVPVGVFLGASVGGIVVTTVAGVLGMLIASWTN